MLDKEKVALLHQFRGELEVAKADLTKRMTEWEEVNAGRITHKAVLETAIADLDAGLKAQRVEEYDGADKSKVFGVGIRVKSVVSPYDITLALKWAVKHELASKLDQSAFEKCVKAGMVDFVGMREVVSATIASDLAKYLDD